MTELITNELQDRVLTIIMNRPAKLNALTHAMYTEMAEAIAQSNDNDDVRAIIISGAGEVFTAGNDLEDFSKPMPEGLPPVMRFLHKLKDAKKPVLAAVNGPAIGVGLTMLLHCDLCFASKTASFSAPFAHLGVVPEAASSLLLPSSVGMAWANDILLAGRVLDADEALNIGLVSRLFDADQLREKTREVAKEIACLAPNAVMKSKQLIRLNREQVAKRMDEEATLFFAQLASKDFADSVAALKRRK